MVKVLKNKQKKTHRNVKKYTKRSTGRSTRSSNLKNTKRKTKENKRRRIRKNNLRKNSKKIKRKNKYGKRGGGPTTGASQVVYEKKLDGYRLTDDQLRKQREGAAEYRRGKAESNKWHKEHKNYSVEWSCTEEAVVKLSPQKVKEDSSKDELWNEANKLTRSNNGREKIKGWKEKLKIFLKHPDMKDYVGLKPKDILKRYKEEEEAKAARAAQVGEPAEAAQGGEPEEETQGGEPEEAAQGGKPEEDTQEGESLLPPQKIGVGGKKCGIFDRFCAVRPVTTERRPNKNRGGGGRRKRPQKTKRRTKRTN